jgi:hypothetical protein
VNRQDDLPGRIGARLVDELPPSWCRALSVRLAAVGEDRPAHLRAAVGWRALAATAGCVAGALATAGSVLGGGAVAPLSTEFARLQAEILAGVARIDALRSLAQRCPIDEVRSFSMAMTQVESFGVPVAPMLRAQAEEIRVRHRQDAQERAQKAPVKMLVPLVACIFPALLVVVAGPAILSIRAAFSS